MKRHLMIAAVSLALASCSGADKTPSTPTATPTPVAQATPTPAPAPTPAPTADPLGLAPGPVDSIKAYLKTVETTRGSGEFRDAQKDASGMFVLYVGEYVVVDSTQLNAAGQICRWSRDPVYLWNNDEGMMNIRSSSEPFFFKFDVARPGYAEIVSKMDGAVSNDLKMRAIRR